MSKQYDKLFEDAKAENAQWDIEDCICRGSNYFLCGFKPLSDKNGRYYNNVIAVAFAVIGRLYTSKNSQSDYRRGIDYIASHAGVTKRHVKALRKMHKAHIKNTDGYVFKTPYDMACIITKMIELLENKKSNPLIVYFLKEYKQHLYRDVLVRRQFLEVEISANSKNAPKKVRDTYSQLNHIVTIV